MASNIGSYTNPVISGFNPDPSIIRVNGDYFLVTSSFEYFPGAPIYHSTDLIRWELIGHALTRTSQLQIHQPEPGGGVWATTLRYHAGIFYIVTASFDRLNNYDQKRAWPRGFCVHTQNIWDSDSWSDPVYFDQVGFDQDLFWDDDGQVYLSTTYPKLVRTRNANLKDFAIHICTIDLKTGSSTSEPKLIRESPSGIAEGSHILKRGRFYYLFTAEGGTGSKHSEWVCRTEVSPYGPWEAMLHPLCHNETDDEVQNTGHADLVEDLQGRWWAVILAVRPVKMDVGWGVSVFGRETFLVSVDWIDDWPVFNGGRKITIQATAPGLYQNPSSAAWRDDFSTRSLKLGWYRKNTSYKIDYSLTDRPNYLRLHGGPYNLSIPASPTLLLRKQTHRFCTWETRLTFYPKTEYSEAGTVVWWNYFSYCSIGIRTNGKSRLVRFQVEGQVVEQKLQNNCSDVVFFIECGDRYRFGYRETNDGPEIFQTQWIGGVSNEAMTREPPTGFAFTGMMLGVYSFSERQHCFEPADFHYVEIR